MSSRSSNIGQTRRTQTTIAERDTSMTTPDKAYERAVTGPVEPAARELAWSAEPEPEPNPGPPLLLQAN
jgi:hypothetical protein